MARLKEMYDKEFKKSLKEELKIKNEMVTQKVASNVINI